MILVDDCKNHDYVFIKREFTLVTEIYIRVIPKETYACIHCGLAMEVYNLERKIDMETKK